MHSPYTDLAMEVRNRNVAAGMAEPEGIRVEEAHMKGVTVTRVFVESEEGQRYVNKPVGRYVTLEVEALRSRDRRGQEKAADVLAKELAALLPENRGTVLVTGLGNAAMTADALGPRTAEQVMATRHFVQAVPEQVDERVRAVSVIAPGVLGATGVESMEAVRGTVGAIDAGCVVAVDALAALDVKRLGTTLQLTDAGISPGSGLGNRRSELSRETLGVPVIALGVPTVVYAATVAREVLENTLHTREVEEHMRAWEAGDAGRMVVTPKDIDVLIRDAAALIAMGLNLALHPGVSRREIADFLH